jgi:hypothetical protein
VIDREALKEMFDSIAEQGKWHMAQLHDVVQRVEVHSVDSFFARNEQLDDFAREHRLDSRHRVTRNCTEKLERQRAP